MIDINQSSLCEIVAECNEFSEETDKTFRVKQRLSNLIGFNKINERMIKQKVLVKTKDRKYYLNK